MEEKPRSRCPISLALEVIGDKWSLLILRDALLNGKQRYQEFLASQENISTNILADRLSRLEEMGILLKKDDPMSGRQYLYFPTEKGLDLLPVLKTLGHWSCKYDSRVDKTLPTVKRLKSDQKKLAKEMKNKFEKESL